MLLLNSLIQKINYYKTIMNTNFMESTEYHKLNEEYLITNDKSKKEQILNEIELLNICEGEFLNSYINNIRIFLINVNDNFEKKFKNNEFKLEDDKYIFEDYIQFLCNYKFESDDSINNRIINFLNDTFSPMEKAQKIELIEKYNELFACKLITCKLNNDKLIRIKKDKKIDEIENVEIYAFPCLLEDLYCKQSNLDYYLNKNLKPNFYQDNLFIMKNKNIWKY